MVDAVKIDVGNDVSKVFVPVHTLLKLGLTNDWPFKVKKLTSWLLVDAVVAQRGTDKNVFSPFIFWFKLCVLSTKLSSTYSLFATLWGVVGSFVVQLFKLQSVKLLDVIVSTLIVLNVALPFWIRATPSDIVFIPFILLSK